MKDELKEWGHSELFHESFVSRDKEVRISSVISSDTAGRSIDAGEQGYFEGGGGYRVAVIIEPDLNATGSSELEKY